ncbi:MAG: hypothetical protein OHK0017_09120 [Patescibacteria group bacterium]
MQSDPNGQNLNNPQAGNDQQPVTEANFRRVVAPPMGISNPAPQPVQQTQTAYPEQAYQTQTPTQPAPTYNAADPSYYSGFSTNFNAAPTAPAPKPAGPNMMSGFKASFAKWKQTPGAQKLLKFWWLWLSAAILIVSLIVAGIFVSGIFETKQTNFSNVTGEIVGESRIPSGSLGTWNVKIENKETVALDKVKVYLQFDKSFAFSKSLNQTPVNEPPRTYGSVYDLGQLKPFGTGGSNALVTLEGTLTGSLDTEAVMTGKVQYQPVGSKQTFEQDLKFSSTKIGAPEITVELTAPTQIRNGNEEDVFVEFRNTSDKTLSNLRIKLTYPNNDFYISSELQLTKTSEVQRQPTEGDNVWLVPELPRFTPQQLKVRGRFVGAPGEIKNVKVEISTKNPQGTDYVDLVAKSRTVAITGDLLQVSTSISNKDSNKIFAPGDTLNVDVTFKNGSVKNIEDMTVLAWLDDPAEILDYSTISYSGGDRGTYNNGRLEWKQSGAPQLKILPPNSSGKLSFNIRVKEGKDFLNGKPQTEFTLKPRAIVSALGADNVTVAGNEYKAQGSLTFTPKVEYQAKVPSNPNDTSSTVTCNKEQRLVKDQPACFVVTWTLNTSQNNINNVVVKTRTTLPNKSAKEPWDQTSVTPITENGVISYDKVTGEILWKPGNLPGYTGVSKPERTVSFIITFIPDQAQINSGSVNLYEKVTVSGVDDFTLQNYQIDVGAATVR